MQSMLSNVLLFAALVYGAAAQKKGDLPRPVQIITGKAQPTTAPRLIDESLHKKDCPAGFQFVGKQCAKTITAPVDTLCPPGTININGKCVKFVGKNGDCPEGFLKTKEGCIRRSSAPTYPVCPPGFDLVGRECLRKVPLGETKECPVGSVLKGDNCVKSVLEAPEYLCPPTFVMIGKKCQRESTFDCTPPRKPATLPEEKKGEAHLRQVSKGKESNVYHIPVSNPFIEEYVIQETCKRVITELAHPICVNEGSFNGKMCERDIIVPAITRPGGFRDLAIPAAFVCPEGFAEMDKNGECFALEYAPPALLCPPGTNDLGDKCAIYLPPKNVCPDGFYLDGKICSKTIFVAPLVEYTLTYTCTGKDCAAGHGKH